MSKASKFRELPEAELEAQLVDLNKEIFEFINQKQRTKKMDQPHLLREKKKDKARLLTILHEKQSLGC